MSGEYVSVMFVPLDQSYMAELSIPDALETAPHDPNKGLLRVCPEWPEAALQLRAPESFDDVFLGPALVDHFCIVPGRRQ